MELNRGSSKSRQAQHPRRKAMILRAVHKYSLCPGAQKYEELPEDLRRFYSHFTYQEIIRPLVCDDKRDAPGISYQALATRYGIDKTSAYRIIMYWLDHRE